MKKTVLLLSLILASVISVNAQGGYRGFVDVGPSMGKSDVLLYLTTAHGYQFNQNWFLGAGISGTLSLEHGEIYTIPVFAKLRYDVLSEKTLTWFADANLGGHVLAYDSPLYVSFIVGLRQRLTERLGINYGIGISTCPDDWEEQSEVHFNIKIGIDF